MHNNETELKNLFSENLKKLMEMKSISEILLSEKTGISQSAINRLKNGAVSPSFYQAMKLAEFFNLDVNELLKKEKKIVTNEKFIPVISAHDFLNEKKTVQGFIAADEAIIDTVGFKTDQSFSCNFLKKDTIVIVKKIENKNKVNDTTTVLFVDGNTYKIGTVSDKKVRPIDDLMKLYDINKIQLIGTVIRMDTNYIREKSLVEKIMGNIGKIRWVEQINMNLGIKHA